MAATSKLVKFFDQFGGIDFRISDIRRQANAATVMKNIIFRETGALSKRPGFKYIQAATDDSGGGLLTYKEPQAGGGASDDVVFYVGDDHIWDGLRDPSPSKLSVTYSGGKTATYSMQMHGPTSGIISEDQLETTEILIDSDHTFQIADTVVIPLDSGIESIQTVLSLTDNSIIVNTPVTVKSGTIIGGSDSLTGQYEFVIYEDGKIVPTWGGSTNDVSFTASGVDDDNESIKLSNHGLRTAQAVQFTTTNTLPTGISLLTTYYVIVVDLNNIQLHTTIAGAITGTTDINILSQGIGTHTINIGLPRALKDGLTTSDYDVGQLNGAISAIPDWASSSVLSPNTQSVASSFPLGSGEITTSTPIAGTQYDKINGSPQSAIQSFLVAWNAVDTPEWRNFTSVQMGDVLYIATGPNGLWKWDGLRLYRAGIPKPTLVSLSEDSPGANFKYDYTVTYEFTDDKGNFVESTPMDVATADTGVAIAVGGSSDVVITLNNNLTSEIGTASGYHSNSSEMKVNLWRTSDYLGSGPGLKYLVETKTNTQGSQLVFTDALPDADLIANTQFVQPVTDHGIPPAEVYYVDSWRGQLLLGGIFDEGSSVRYSDIDSPEYFPELNSIGMESPVTGLKGLDNTFFVFQENAINGITGDLATDSIQNDRLSREGIGCVAHATIQEVRGEIYFLDSSGVFSISNQGIRDIGAPIAARFQKRRDISFDLEYATAFNWVERNLYIVYAPVVGRLAGVKDPSTSERNSETYVFDYDRQAWVEWDNWHMLGGMAALGDSVWISDRYYNANQVANEGRIALVHNNLVKEDYEDHGAPINFDFRSHWETLGDPSIWKKFLRCKVHSYNVTIDDFEVDNFQLDVSSNMNYSTLDLNTVRYDFTSRYLAWGTGAWGVYNFGSFRFTQIKRRLPSKKVRSLRMNFNNSELHENVLISGFELEVVTPYQSMKV